MTTCVPCAHEPAGFSSEGSANQPDVNGVFTANGQTQNGLPVRSNRAGLVLYWTRDGGGKWVIANAIGSGLLARQPDGTDPDGTMGPAAGGSWASWNRRTQRFDGDELSLSAIASFAHRPRPLGPASSASRLTPSTVHLLSRCNPFGWSSINGPPSTVHLLSKRRLAAASLSLD